MENNVFDEAEREHLHNVLAAFHYYRSFSLQRIGKTERFISTLPEHHKELVSEYSEMLLKLRSAVDANNHIIDFIIQDANNIFENVPESVSSSSFDPSSVNNNLRPKNRDVEKVQSVLRQLVRDWSAEGEDERLQCYQPIIDEIASEFPSPSGVSVLVPGSGLGRLAYEIALRGYKCQGNEFSLFMLFASNFVINKSQKINQYTFHPWVHHFVNNLTKEDQLQSITFPDVNPSTFIGGEFSMVAGDFTKVYKEENEFDCIATCFFIDCATNVIEYIDTIYHILKPGGVWINLGPLLYHYSDIPNEDSIEPPYDILCDIIKNMGFVMEKSKTGVKTKYAQNPKSMLQHEYDSVFFVCRKPFEETELPTTEFSAV